MSKLHQKTKNRGNQSTKRAENDESSPVLMGKHLLKSVSVTLLISMILLLLSSLAAYFSKDPASLIPPLGLLSSFVAAFLGGLVAVRIHGRSALLCGLSNGILFSALMLLASLFFRPHATGYSALVSCILHVSFLLISVAGGYLGLKKGKPKKKKH